MPSQDIKLVRNRTIVTPDGDGDKPIFADIPEVEQSFELGGCDCTVTDVLEVPDGENLRDLGIDAGPPSQSSVIEADYLVMFDEHGRTDEQRRLDMMPDMGESVTPQTDGPFDLRLWYDGTAVATDRVTSKESIPEAGDTYERGGDSFEVRSIGARTTRGAEGFNVHIADSESLV